MLWKNEAVVLNDPEVILFVVCSVKRRLEDSFDKSFTAFDTTNLPLDKCEALFEGLRKILIKRNQIHFASKEVERKHFPKRKTTANCQDEFYFSAWGEIRRERTSMLSTRSFHRV